MIDRIKNLINNIVESSNNFVIVYRGLNMFNPEIHDGNFYSTDYDFAKSYGSRIRKYKLYINNCFNIIDKDNFKTLKNKVGILTDPYALDVDDEDDYYFQFKDIKSPDILSDSGNTWEITEEYLSDIASLGFDMAKILEDGIENYVLINPNKVKLEYVGDVNEDYTSDKEKLSEASNIFENFQEKLIKLNPEDVSTIYVNKNGNRFLSYLIDYSQIDNNYENLSFLLVGNRYVDEKSLKTIQYTGDPSYISKKKINGKEINMISIPLGYSTVLQTYNEIQNDWGEYARGMFEDELKKLQNQILSKRYVVIHELVHYLDEMRYTNTYSYDGYKNPSKGDSFRDYVNQPDEYNAFYLQSIYKLNQRIDSDLAFDENGKHKIEVIFQKFDNFLEYYKETCDRYSGGKIPDFTIWFGKYLKKINKRLYQYYINKRQELGIQ